MTNTVCYESKEAVKREFQAKDVVGVNFQRHRTAFVGDDCSRKSKLFLVNNRSVFPAEQPNLCYFNVRSFTNVRWVDVEIHVKEKECV